MVKVSSIGEVSRLRVVRFGLFIISALCLQACDFQSESRSSILVVAVEGLGFETFNCDSDQLQDRDMAGFKVFCDESIRFTHAFAPSTMSQATMASLLTGQYPIDHGIHHNGSQFLSATVETLPEVAVRKGYRTLFVSGGPPVWRKSGLAQGFEVFDDNVEVAPGHYYRPVQDVFSIFRSWINKEVETSPFISFLFLSDLQFTPFTTRAADGEARERSRIGQVAQIGESLDQLVSFLKKNQRWNNTTVVLVGLNGSRSEGPREEPSTFNLKSRSLQVALYVKPARKQRDGALQWTIDKNVSLTDLGWTLFTMMGGEPPPSRWPQIQPVSLAMAFNAPSAGWSENRLILSESAWPQWMAGAGIRWSIRQNQFLYIHDRIPQIYNTLTDRLETMSVNSSDPLWNSLNQDVISFVNEAKLLPWSPLDSIWSDQIEVARAVWNFATDSSIREVLLRETDRNPNQGPWLRWAARVALKEGRWSDLAALGAKAQDEMWIFVGKANSSEHASLPKHPCLKTFVTGLGTRPSECADDSVLALWDWMKADSDEARNVARDKFVRLYLVRWMNDQVGILNYQNELRWDVRRSLPEGPSTVDLILALKEYEPFRQKLQLALGTIDVRL